MQQHSLQKSSFYSICLSTAIWFHAGHQMRVSGRMSGFVVHVDVVAHESVKVEQAHGNISAIRLVPRLLGEPSSGDVESAVARTQPADARTRPTCLGRPYGGGGTGNAARSGRGGSARTASTSSGGCSPRDGSMIRAWGPRWRCCASRGAIPSGVLNARARWPCGR